MESNASIPEQSARQRAAAVQAMFNAIAPRYNLMNRLMTGWQDLRWRKEVIARACIPPDGRLLDLATGTGDLAREALRQVPSCRPVAADFALKMMLTGKQQPGPSLNWNSADALNLPFPDATFDALVSGFLLRNVIDLPGALSEQYRVLKPGGRVVALDTTRPGRSLISPFIRFYMHRVIPQLGTLLASDRDAYTYLPTTSEHFLAAEELQARFQAAGFQGTGFKRRMFGTIAIHWGNKPG